MQKKIFVMAVAAALAAPAAFAKENVTITGLIKAGFESYESTTLVGDKEQRVSDQSSRVIITGSDDLGGGMKGFFQVDSRLSVDMGSGSQSGAAPGATSTFLANGNSGIGLQGGFGKFTVGRWDLHYGEFGAIESSRAGSLQSYLAPGLMSQVSSAAATGAQTIAVGSRSSNVVMWDSANWSGITARVAYSTNMAATEGSGATADGSKGDAINLVLRYAAGPLVAGISLWDHEAEGGAGTGDQKSTRAWVGYTLGDLKVGLGYDVSEFNTAATTTRERSAILLPVSYGFGNHKLYAAMAMADDFDINGVTTASSGADGLSVGWDYAFSKRTSAGVFYTKVDNDSAANYNMFGLGGTGATVNTTGNDSKQIYFGLAHSF